MAHELHPLCTLFPRLSGAEFEALKADIAANGLRQPIVLLDGMILDGGNRYRACVEAGVDPVFTEYTGGNIVSFVLSANLHRRHMTPGQQAAIVASAQDWAQAQVQGANRHTIQTGNVAGLVSVKDRAAQSGAGERTQRMADKVAKKSPELAKQVAHGEISLPKAVAKVEGKEAKPKAAPVSQPPANDDMDDAPDLGELIDELQAENVKLRAEIAAAEADDLKAEAIKWRRCYENAQRQQSEAMDRVLVEQRNAKRIAKILRACCDALNVDDPTKLLQAIKALSAQKVAA